MDEKGERELTADAQAYAKALVATSLRGDSETHQDLMAAVGMEILEVQRTEDRRQLAIRATAIIGTLAGMVVGNVRQQAQGQARTQEDIDAILAAVLDELRSPYDVGVPGP